MQRPRLSYPPNPDYGTGICRRRIRIVRTRGRVEASLADPFHEMTCIVDHDGKIVTGLEGEAIRFPTSSCPAAAHMLQELVGTAIDMPQSHFMADGRPRRHCTHLYDLAVLAVRHSGLEEGVTVYEASVPDEQAEPVYIEVARNGAVIHRWQIRDGLILTPAAYHGRVLGQGFARWAVTSFPPDDLEAATVLARTWLIAIGRRYLTEAFAGESITRNDDMIGRCFAYDPIRAATTTFNSGQIQDFKAN